MVEVQDLRDLYISIFTQKENENNFLFWDVLSGVDLELDREKYENV